MDQRRKSHNIPSPSAFKKTYSHSNLRFFDSLKLNTQKDSSDINDQRWLVDDQLDHNNHKIQESLRSHRIHVTNALLPKDQAKQTSMTKTLLKSEASLSSRLYVSKKRNSEQLNDFIEDNMRRAINREKIGKEAKIKMNLQRHIQEEISQNGDLQLIKKNSQEKNGNLHLKIPSIHSKKSSQPLDSVSRQKNFVWDTTPISKGYLLKGLPTDSDRAINLEQDLLNYLNSTTMDNLNSRHIALRLRDWLNSKFSRLPTSRLNLDEEQLQVLNISMKELIRQLSIECTERGQVLQDVWEKCFKFVQSFKFQIEMQKEQDEIAQINEYNRVHQMYKEKDNQKINEIEQLKEQLGKQIQQIENLKGDLTDTQTMYSKVRDQLAQYKQMAQLLKKRGDQYKFEMKIIQKREQHKNKLLHDFQSPVSRVLAQSGAPATTMNKFPSSTDVAEDEKFKDLKLQINDSDKDSEPSTYNALDDMFADKNVIELNTMIMNMDKVITVKDCEVQVKTDDLAPLVQSEGTQTQLELLGNQFDVHLCSMEKIRKIIDQENYRNKLDRTVGIINERLSLQLKNNQFEGTIENNFFIENIIHQTVQESNHNLDQSNPMLASSVLKTSSSPIVTILDPSQSPTNFTLESSHFRQAMKQKQLDIQKVRGLLQIIHSHEQNKKQLEQQVGKKISEIAQLTNQENILSQKLNHLETLTGEQAIQIQKLSHQIENMIPRPQEVKEVADPDAKKSRKHQKNKKSQQDRLMMFKGPHLGQKVTLTFEFQKNNQGKVIVDKVKNKQVQKLKTFMPLKLLLKQIYLIYQERITQQKENPQVKEQDLASFSYAFFFQQYGFQKIVEQKFLILVLSVKHHRQVIRVNTFAKFLGLFESSINYSHDEFIKYMECLEFVTCQSQLGVTIQDNDSELKYYIPYLRAQQYISQFADSRMTPEEREDLKRETELMKENDQKNINKYGILDFDQFMINLFVKYRILVSRAKEYVINAFAACDLDGNGMCNFEEWYLLLRHIEPERFSHEQVSEIFFNNADLFIDGEQNFSFEKFAVVCVEHNIFSDDTQNAFLGISGKKIEILSQFKKVWSEWTQNKKVIEERFDKITFLDSEKLDHWREIISALEGKLEETSQKIDTQGADRKMKPLLIAYLLLWNESILLQELQEGEEEIQNEENDEEAEDIASPLE